jgi:hypothetical protein
MSRYRVDISETVYYQIVVEADSEEEARELAVEEHGDGLSSETDNGAAEVDTVTKLTKKKD